MFLPKYNMVIVGGGIAGLATAYFYTCAFPDHDVLLLERRGPGRTQGLGGLGAGLTGRAGGHRMHGFEANYSKLEEILGRKGALDLYAETVAMSQDTDRIIAEEGIICGNRHGYWIADEVGKIERIGEFLRPRKMLGLPEPHYHNKNKLKQHVDFAGFDEGLYFPDIASFDPPKFIYGLAEAFQRRGGHIAEGYEYKKHMRASGKVGNGACVVQLANGDSVYADRLVLAGGDILSRNIPFLHNRTTSVYTGRVAVRLPDDVFRAISPKGVPLVGCDSDLKSDHALDGDFLWFSLRHDPNQCQNAYLVMGFGGSFAGFTAARTQHIIEEMEDDVCRELLERVPALKGLRLKPTVGALNTSSNLLPIMGLIGPDENVYAIAAQSGVGLNQSMLLAKALVDKLKGKDRVYNWLQELQREQYIIPTAPLPRRVAEEVGARLATSPEFVQRAGYGAAAFYTRVAAAHEGTHL